MTKRELSERVLESRQRLGKGRAAVAGLILPNGYDPGEVEVYKTPTFKKKSRGRSNSRTLFGFVFLRERGERTWWGGVEERQEKEVEPHPGRKGLSRGPEVVSVGKYAIHRRQWKA